MSKSKAPNYPANVGDIVILRTNYFDEHGNMLERKTQHEILGHRVGYGEPCFEVICENDTKTKASNILPYSRHLIPFRALVEVLPKRGQQLELF